jgi:uncharacterized protein DUF2171
MAREETPIAWMALRRGHPVTGSDGEHAGKVSEVVGDQQKDIFSGIAFRPGILDRERFAPADLIETITSEAIHLRIPAAEAEALEPYEG